MNKRRFDRHGCRIPCRLRVDDSEHGGFVTDISANGLFVQSSHKLEPGTKIVLELDVGDGAPLTLTGTITRERRAHRGVSAVVMPGIGVGLDSAPEAYFQLVMDMHGA